MTQGELHHAIARATGDDLATVRRRGFQIASRAYDSIHDGDLPAPQYIDWDELYSAEERRRALFM